MDERSAVESELDAYLERADDADLREIADGEVSIAAWADRDPGRAMVIASRWATRMKRLAFRRKLVQHVFEERVEPLVAWREEQLAAIAREEAFGANLLEVYAHDFHPDEKTVALPDATLKRRANRGTLEWDEDEALRYQREHYPEDVTQKLAKKRLRDRLVQRGGEWFDEHTGEQITFLREVPPEKPETFTVEVKDDE